MRGSSEQTYLFGLLVAVVELAGSLGAARHDLLPAVRDGREQVADQDHVLLLAEVLQVRAYSHNRMFVINTLKSATQLKKLHCNMPTI